MKCPECGYVTAHGYLFCTRCGTKLSAGTTKCSRCGSELLPGSTMCGQCNQVHELSGSRIKRFSKPFYLGFFLFYSLSTIGWFVYYERFDLEGNISPPLYIIIITAIIGLFGIIGNIITLIFWYRAWASIQDGLARTTPWKAIGFLFIPFFNLYWLFQLIWGFAKDYNTYVARHQITPWRIDERLFLALPMLFISGLFLGLLPIQFLGYSVTFGFQIVTVMVIDQVCNAVNTLADYYEARSPQTAK